MGVISIQYFKSPIGELILGSYMDKLCLCDWKYRKMRESIDQRIQSGLNANYLEQTSELIEQAKIQIKEYFSLERKKFEIPLLMVGTEFQKSVWDELTKISYGKTETYLGLSEKLNKKLAIRAVASANGANAISLIVPCHRIIGSRGELVGYSGGLTAKKNLLKLEGYQRNQLQLF